MAEHPAPVMFTRSNLNPRHPASASFYSPGDVAYIMTVPGQLSRTKVVTSAGRMGPSWAVGSERELISDQSRQSLGIYRITGIVDFATGEREGEVPDSWRPHWVLK